MKNEELNKLVFGSWPLPAEYLLELGRIVALWTVTEKILGLFLAKMSGYELNDPRGTILFNNHTIPQKIDTLGCLVEQYIKSHPNLKEYPDALSKLRVAQKNRNKYVHSNLYFDTELKKVVVSYASTRGKLKTNSEKTELIDLKRVVLEIAEANKALYKVVLNREIPFPWENEHA